MDSTSAGESAHARPLLCDRMVLAITGSPAALSMPQTVLMLRQGLVGHVRVMMSAAACRLLRPSTMRLVAGDWVYTDLHPPQNRTLIPHLDLTADIDLFLVMPATANLVAKAAHGICDDLISTAIVACPAPVVLVPAMNETMWRSKVVQRNVGIAAELGYRVIDPGIGVQLADLRAGQGVMPPLEHFLDQLMDIVASAKGERRDEDRS